MLENKTSGAGAGETFLYILLGLIAVCVVGAQYIDAILDTLGELLAFVCLPALAIVLFCLAINWLVNYRRTQTLHHAQVEAIRAQTSHALTDYVQIEGITIPRSTLHDPAVVAELLRLASHKLEMSRTHAPAPHHYHVVNSTDNTLNGGAAAPAITGDVGGLSVLLAGGQDSRLKLIDAKQEDTSND